MSLELELIRAYRRYLEHLAGKHNQKSHGNKYGSVDAIKANVKRLGGDKAALKSMAKRARKDKDFQGKVKAGAQAKKDARLKAEQAKKSPEKPKGRIDQPGDAQDHVKANPHMWGMAQYQIAMNVKQPWMGEISELQMSRMSKRAKNEYLKKRSEEWEASAEIKREYVKRIGDMFDAGKIDINTPGIHKDAVSAIAQRMIANKARDVSERMKVNQIITLDNVEVGDRVFNQMVGQYGIVVKKSKKSIQFAPDTPLPSFNAPPKTKVKAPLGAIQWMNYDDAKATAEKGEPIALR